MLEGGKFQLLDVRELALDIDNPRVKKYLEYYDEPSDENLKLALGVGAGDDASESGTTYQSLRDSIRESGGIIHPIIVNDEGDRKTVVEGNTRLSIYQEFLEQELTGDWSKIPAIVYKNLDQENIDKVRLQSHLVGPRAWDPYSKAKYLAHLYSAEHMSVERIYAYCGGKRREIEDYIAAYYDMEKYYRPALASDQDFDTTRFSGFVELQRPGVKDALQRRSHGIDEFSLWLHKKKIETLPLVRRLPKIFSNDKAYTVFLERGAKAADRSLDSPEVEKALADLDLATLCQTLQRAIESLPYGKMKEMAGNEDDSDRSALLALYTSYQDLVSDLEGE